MADNVISNLSIVVNTNADEVAGKFKRLTSAVSGLGKAASSAGGGMETAAEGADDMGMQTQEAGKKAGKAANQIGKFWTAIRNIGKSGSSFGQTMNAIFVSPIRAGIGALGSFFKSFARIAKIRIFRALLKDLAQGFKDLYGWSNMFGNEYADSMDRITTATRYLRNSIAAMTAPLVNALAPALDFIIDKIVDVLNWFNQLFAALAGQDTYIVAKKAAVTFGDSIGESASSAKKSVEELKRTILGFDEINKLDKPRESGSSGGSGSSPYTSGYQTMFEEKALTGGFKGFSNAIENALKDTLSRIGLIISGAALAVGAILTFSGVNLPLGLSLMAAGAAGLVSIIGMNWEGLSADVKLVIGAVEAAIGGSLLALGGIIAFSGVNPALGIAMMAAGAASLAAAVGLNWDFLTGKVKASAKGIIGAISAASVAVGAILAFTGVNVPLGVGLIAAGVTGAAATISWDYLKEKITGTTGLIVAGVSGASLALGAVLAFSGVAIPLGIGLMAAGAVGLATAATVNWNTIKEKISGPLADATLVVSGATLVIGILALLGGMIPLGLGLLLSGAAGLVTTIAANWDNLVQIGKNALTSVKKGWDSLKDKAFEIAAFIGTKASDLWQGVKNGWDNLSGKLVEFWANLKNDAPTWWKNVKAWWRDTTLGQTVDDFIANVKNKAGLWWADVKTWWHNTTVGKTVDDFIANVKNKAGLWWADVKSWWRSETIGKTVEDFIANVKNKAGLWWADVKTWWRSETIGKTVEDFIANVKNKAGLWWADVKSWWRSETIGKTVEDFIANVKNKASLWWADVKSWWRKATNGKTVADFIANVNNKSAQWWEDVQKWWKDTTLGKTVEDFVTNVKNKASDWWDNVKKWWKKKLGTNDGSAFEPFNVIANIVSAIGDLWANLKQRWTNFFSGKSNTDEEYTLAAKSRISSTIAELWGQLKQIWDDGIAEIGGFLEVKVRPLLETVGGKIVNLAKDTATTIWDWLFPGAKAEEVEYPVYFNAEPGYGLQKGKGYGSKGLELSPISDIGANVVANVQPGNGLSRKQAYGDGGGLKLSDVEGTKTTVSVDIDTVWSLITGILSYLGLINLSTTVKVELAKWGWSDLASWIGTNQTYTVTIDLQRGNWYWGLADFIGKSVSVRVDLYGGGGVVKQHQGHNVSVGFADGGVITQSAWRKMPKMAGGGSRPHGTMFVAGEAGPEIVGHINSRTEVLNQSQLAQTMFAAVRSAMSGVQIAATMYDGGAGSDESDYEMMYRAMYDAYTDAMAGSNERDREKVALMREIASKDFTAEITTASMNRAQSRMNRRAGTTIVPVGT